jgi:predicted O-linked N-acetylglucosamine transferase (SPINDLY family)
LDDAIAADLDGYVALAIRLGRDRAALAALAARTAERRAIVWRDRAPVAALADFLERAAEGRA